MRRNPGVDQTLIESWNGAKRTVTQFPIASGNPHRDRTLIYDRVTATL
jgi:hypothetical protein